MTTVVTAGSSVSGSAASAGDTGLCGIMSFLVCLRNLRLVQFHDLDKTQILLAAAESCQNSVELNRCSHDENYSQFDKFTAVLDLKIFEYKKRRVWKKRQKHLKMPKASARNPKSADKNKRKTILSLSSFTSLATTGWNV